MIRRICQRVLITFWSIVRGYWITSRNICNGISSPNYALSIIISSPSQSREATLKLHNQLTTPPLHPLHYSVHTAMLRMKQLILG
jgi:hypothetical protein